VRRIYDKNLTNIIWIGIDRI